MLHYVTDMQINVTFCYSVRERSLHSVTWGEGPEKYLKYISERHRVSAKKSETEIILRHEKIKLKPIRD